MSSASGESWLVVQVALIDGADSWLAEELATEGGDPLANLLEYVLVMAVQNLQSVKCDFLLPLASTA